MSNPFRYFNSSPEVIRLVVMMYVRYPLVLWTTVISISTDPYQWTAGDAWWDVGVPQVSARPEVAAAYAEQVAGRQPQRYGV
jgi:hypothetical protein